MAIYVTKSAMPTLAEYTEQIAQLFQTGMLSNMGVKHQELEQRLAKRLKVPQLELFVNGHTAIESALAVALPKKGEIITTPFTFVSTTHAIVRTGHTPVFCDIRPEDYTLDPEKIEGLITENTVAILPVHVYGNLCQVDKIQKIAQKHHLKVIYDAAHAFAVEENGVGAGTFGDLSCFSFHATKVFHTIEGGAVSFHDPAYQLPLLHYKNFGIAGETSVDMVGENGKLSEFSAAMGLCNLTHLEKNLKKRGEIFAQYQAQLRDCQGIHLLSPQNTVANFAYVPVRFSSGQFRDHVQKALADQEIYSRKYFYPLTSQMGCYQSFESYTPVAEEITEQMLTLPIYPQLDPEEVGRICTILKEVGKEYTP